MNVDMAEIDIWRLRWVYILPDCIGKRGLIASLQSSSLSELACSFCEVVSI